MFKMFAAGETDDSASDALEREQGAEAEPEEDDEDEAQEEDTPGAMFYAEMKRRGLVDDGEWSDIVPEIKSKWEEAVVDMEPDLA